MASSSRYSRNNLKYLKITQNNELDKIKGRLSNLPDNIEELQKLLGRGRAKKGMFEGNLEDGELEIGQVSAYIHEIVSAKEVVDELISGCKLALERVNDQFEF